MENTKEREQDTEDVESSNNITRVLGEEGERSVKATFEYKQLRTLYKTE